MSPYLGFRFATMKSVQVMHGTLGGRPRVRQDLENVEVVAQRVCGHQEHTCRTEHILVNMKRLKTTKTQ